MEYVIIETHSNYRSGIRSGFKIFSVTDFIEKYKKQDKGHYYGTLRYCKVDGSSEAKFTAMTVVEFESIFLENGKCVFDHKQVDDLFGKVVKEKYGTISKFKGMRKIPKKDLEVGTIYINDKDEHILYCGQVECSSNTYGSNKTEYGFLSCAVEDINTFKLVSNDYNSLVNDSGDRFSFNASITKTCTGRLMIKTNHKISLKQNVSINKNGRSISLYFLEG